MILGVLFLESMANKLHNSRVEICMYHSLLWRHIILVTICVYSSSYGVLYNTGIGMTRRHQNSVGTSVCLLVRPFAMIIKNVYSSIISKIIIRMSGKRAL